MRWIHIEDWAVEHQRYMRIAHRKNCSWFDLRELWRRLSISLITLVWLVEHKSIVQSFVRSEWVAIGNTHNVHVSKMISYLLYRLKLNRFACWTPTSVALYGIIFEIEKTVYSGAFSLMCQKRWAIKFNKIWEHYYYIITHVRARWRSCWIF